ncbi:MAG: S-layer homology domain-containing protein, partial [Clostridia bacterium]|nr:S-layer homology domain-containing protein [Clostridia bacterium]
MKKIVSLFLAVLMLVSPMAISAAGETDAYVYGPKKITVENLVTGTGMAIELVEEGSKTFLHCTAPEGTYGNGSLQFMFSTSEINLMEYPFIKISYRTDSSSHVADTTIRYNGINQESWPAAHPRITSGGKWTDIIINLNTMEKGSGIPGENVTDTKLVLKPFGQGSVTITGSKYFDIEYIGCFKSEEEAKKYKFEGEENIVVPEKPTFGENFFYEKATDELINGYMAKMDERIEEIKNTPTTVEVTGTKYYVSVLGSDSNDGKSPETPWKTINKVNTAKLEAGDGVFFKRGEEWRSSSALSTRGGITYSAYGTGAKPKLNFSIKADGAENWIETEYPNVYKYAGKISGANDVGTIVFDGGRAWGIQVHYDTKGRRFVNYTDKFNTLFNGIESFKVTSEIPEAPHALKNNLEYHHNWETEELFLCSTAGNPGEVFSSIEIVDKGHGVYGTSNVTLDNLHIHGAGSHGVSCGGVTNLTVQNCVLTWIGGAVQGSSLGDQIIRFGNAVEVYGRGDGYTIYNNYASQIYDCCWTIQNGAASPFKNIHFYENVSEFCNSGLEVWQPNGGEFTNMQLHDNYTRFNGYGWSHQRTNGGGATFYGADGVNNGTFENCDIYNNVSLFCSETVVRCGSAGYSRYNFHDNVYVMENNNKLAFAPENIGEGIGAHRWHNYNEKDLGKAATQGFEQNTKFYYTEPSPYENMFDMYHVENGVSVFEDINDGFWGRDAIDHVSLKGLFNGVTATTFAPDNTMTRGMLVTVLYRMSGTSGYKKSSFTDVSENAWFAPGVAWAEINGIVKAGGKFRPDDNATREEMADMLYRFASSQFKYTTNAAKTFTDSASINKDYVDGVNFCTA